MWKPFLIAFAIVLSSCVKIGEVAGRSSSTCPSGCKQGVLDHLESQRKRIAEGVGLGWCRLSTTVGRAPAPERTLDLRTQGHSDAANEYAPYIITRANRWYWNGDTAAGEQAINLIYNWAAADALARSISNYGNNGQTSSDRWPTYGVLTSTLNTLFLLDNHPSLTPEREAIIWGWIDRTMERGWLFGSLPPGGAGGLNDTEQRKNNHNARRALILLYYGIHKDDQRLINKSLTDIRRSHNAIDRNGVPIDGNRGDWALNYINFALDSMVLHASFLDIVDDGFIEQNPALISKIDAGTTFLFRELRAPSRIHGYAEENVGRPGATYSGRQDAWFARDIHYGAELWAWMDSSVGLRLPNGRNAARAVLGNTSQWSSAKFNETGGGVSCWFR